jgi:DNA-binding NarL/FixJ family response regulator
MTIRSSVRLARRLLAASGLRVVGEAGSVVAALAEADRLRPSAVSVDVELPDGDGIILARQLAAVAPACRSHLDRQGHHHD